MAFKPKAAGKSAKAPAKKAPPFMGKESKMEERMEKGRMPAFKAGGKVKKGC